MNVNNLGKLFECFWINIDNLGKLIEFPLLGKYLCRSIGKQCRCNCPKKRYPKNLYFRPTWGRNQLSQWFGRNRCFDSKSIPWTSLRTRTVSSAGMCRNVSQLHIQRNPAFRRTYSLWHPEAVQGISSLILNYLNVIKVVKSKIWLWVRKIDSFFSYDEWYFEVKLPQGEISVVSTRNQEGEEKSVFSLFQKKNCIN